MRKSSPPPLTLDAPDLRVELLGLSLYTAFQPILSASHARIVGYEALLRADDGSGHALHPPEIFGRLETQLSPARIHQTCSQVHLANFALEAHHDWLFLNVDPTAMSDRQAVIDEFGRMLRLSGIEPHRVVVEIIETKVYDERLLAQAVTGFRELGCLVAIDDFGAGESNFERIWRLRPDLVKIDRSMIAEAEESSVVRRILPGLVSLLHQAGCLVVVEGIETAKQALIALGADVDFVQGYFFARPVALGSGSDWGHPEPQQVRRTFEHLILALKHGADEQEAIDLDFFQCFTSGFETCLAAIEDGVPFFDACSTFLAVAGVQRVYLLDELGYQVGMNAESNRGVYVDPRLEPCADAGGSNWYRRSYFQAAVRTPGKVHISRPYLSVRDAQSCVTMSIAFETKEGLRVLCADLDHDPVEPISERSPRDSRILRR